MIKAILMVVAIVFLVKSCQELNHLHEGECFKTVQKENKK